MTLSELLGAYLPGGENELSSRLRLWRTLFINRWHAAVTIGEARNCSETGARSEQINHAASLAEYLWFFGAFCENDQGTGRVDVNGSPSPSNGLRHIVEELGPYDVKVARAAVHYTIWKYGNYRIDPAAMERLVKEDLSRVSIEIGRIDRFARRIRGLQVAMLRFYVEMNFLGAVGDRHLAAPRNQPVTSPVFSADVSPSGSVSVGWDEVPVKGDPILAVHTAFGKNIYHALCWRARHELAKSGALQPWRAGAEFRTCAIVDGKFGLYTSRDPALVSMLSSLSEPPFPLIVQLGCSIRRAVSTMITALPMFILRNFFRDTLAAFVLGRHVQTPVVATLSGAFQAMGGMGKGYDESLRDYLLQGGFNSGLAEAEIASGPVDEFNPNHERFAVILRHARKVIFYLTRPAWVAEVGTRLTQYQLALNSGSTRYEAIRDARMVSSDFANIGSSRSWRMYIGTVPFFNAALQGFDQLYQVWRPRYGRQPNEPLLTADQRKHAGKVWACGSMVSIATAALWGWNTSDPDRKLQFESETQYEKSAYVTAYDVYGETDLRIPVPFQIGAAFMKMPEIALDVVTSVESVTGWGFFGHLVHGNVAIGWLPAAVKPIWEVQTNTNFFGEEIVPPYLQMRQPPSSRYFRTTLAPYRTIGEIFNVSPLHVETIVRGYTGHLGNLIMTGLDEFAWNEQTNGEKPFPRFWSYATGLGVIFNPGPDASSWWMNSFYQTQDYYPRCARNGSCAGLVNRLNRLENFHNESFSLSRNRIDAIATSGTTSRASKEFQINEIYANMHERARIFWTSREEILEVYGLN